MPSGRSLGASAAVFAGAFDGVALAALDVAFLGADFLAVVLGAFFSVAGLAAFVFARATGFSSLGFWLFRSERR